VVSTAKSYHLQRLKTHHEKSRYKRMVRSGLSVDDIGLEPTTSSMSATLLDVFHQLPQEQQLLLIQLAKNFK